MELDLAAASQAAAAKRYPGVFTRNAPATQAECVEKVRPLVEAAAPLIAAQVRAQIAADIEALEGPGYQDDEGLIRIAARIARGES